MVIFNQNVNENPLIIPFLYNCRNLHEIHCPYCKKPFLPVNHHNPQNFCLAYHNFRLFPFHPH